MAQISLEELYRGEGAGETYGILGEYDLRHLCNHGTGARYGCQNALGNHRPCVICNNVDIYSHITDTMQRQAAVHIDRKIGGTDARMPTEKREERKRYRPGRIHAVQAQSTGSRDGLCHHD